MPTAQIFSIATLTPCLFLNTLHHPPWPYKFLQLKFNTIPLVKQQQTSNLGHTKFQKVERGTFVNKVYHANVNFEWAK